MVMDVFHAFLLPFINPERARKGENEMNRSLKVILINGELAPCKYDHTTMCAHCVRVNAIFSEKPEKTAKEKATFGTFEKMDKRKFFKILGFNTPTVFRGSSS